MSEQCHHKLFADQIINRIGALPFVDRDNDMCFCDQCSEMREEFPVSFSTNYYSKYSTPIGWYRVALKCNPDTIQKATEIQQKWPASYLGLPVSTLCPVLSGAMAPMSSRVIYANDRKKGRGIVRQNTWISSKGTTEIVDARQIFTSPSLAYASHPLVAPPQRIVLDVPCLKAKVDSPQEYEPRPYLLQVCIFVRQNPDGLGVGAPLPMRDIPNELHGYLDYSKKLSTEISGYPCEKDKSNFRNGRNDNEVTGDIVGSDADEFIIHADKIKKDSQMQTASASMDKGVNTGILNSEENYEKEFVVHDPNFPRNCIEWYSLGWKVNFQPIALLFKVIPLQVDSHPTSVHPPPCLLSSTTLSMVKNSLSPALFNDDRDNKNGNESRKRSFDAFRYSALNEACRLDPSVLVHLIENPYINTYTAAQFSYSDSSNFNPRFQLHPRPEAPPDPFIPSSSVFNIGTDSSGHLFGLADSVADGNRKILETYQLAATIAEDQSIVPPHFVKLARFLDLLGSQLNILMNCVSPTASNIRGRDSQLTSNMNSTDATIRDWVTMLRKCAHDVALSGEMALSKGDPSFTSGSLSSKFIFSDRGKERKKSLSPIRTVFGVPVTPTVDIVKRMRSKRKSMSPHTFDNPELPNYVSELSSLSSSRSHSPTRVDSLLVDDSYSYTYSQITPGVSLKVTARELLRAEAAKPLLHVDSECVIKPLCNIIAVLGSAPPNLLTTLQKNFDSSTILNSFSSKSILNVRVGLLLFEATSTLEAFMSSGDREALELMTPGCLTVNNHISSNFKKASSPESRKNSILTGMDDNKRSDGVGILIHHVLLPVFSILEKNILNIPPPLNPLTNSNSTGELNVHSIAKIATRKSLNANLTSGNSEVSDTNPIFKQGLVESAAAAFRCLQIIVGSGSYRTTVATFIANTSAIELAVNLLLTVSLNDAFKMNHSSLLQLILESLKFLRILTGASRNLAFLHAKMELEEEAKFDDGLKTKGDLRLHQVQRRKRKIRGAGPDEVLKILRDRTDIWDRTSLNVHGLLFGEIQNTISGFGNIQRNKANPAYLSRTWGGQESSTSSPNRSRSNSPHNRYVNKKFVHGVPYPDFDYNGNEINEIDIHNIAQRNEFKRNTSETGDIKLDSILCSYSPETEMEYDMLNGTNFTVPPPDFSLCNQLGQILVNCSLPSRLVTLLNSVRKVQVPIKEDKVTLLKRPLAKFKLCAHLVLEVQMQVLSVLRSFCELNSSGAKTLILETIGMSEAILAVLTDTPHSALLKLWKTIDSNMATPVTTLVKQNSEVRQIPSFVLCDPQALLFWNTMMQTTTQPLVNRRIFQDATRIALMTVSHAALITMYFVEIDPKIRSAVVQAPTLAFSLVLSADKHMAAPIVVSACAKALALLAATEIPNLLGSEGPGKRDVNIPAQSQAFKFFKTIADGEALRVIIKGMRLHTHDANLVSNCLSATALCCSSRMVRAQFGGMKAERSCLLSALNHSSDPCVTYWSARAILMGINGEQDLGQFETETAKRLVYLGIPKAFAALIMAYSSCTELHERWERMNPFVPNPLAPLGIAAWPETKMCELFSQGRRSLLHFLMPPSPVHAQAALADALGAIAITSSSVRQVVGQHEFTIRTLACTMLQSIKKLNTQLLFKPAANLDKLQSMKDEVDQKVILGQQKSPKMRFINNNSGENIFSNSKSMSLPDQSSSPNHTVKVLQSNLIQQNKNKNNSSLKTLAGDSLHRSHDRYGYSKSPDNLQKNSNPSKNPAKASISVFKGNATLSTVVNSSGTKSLVSTAGHSTSFNKKIKDELSLAKKSKIVSVPLADSLTLPTHILPLHRTAITSFRNNNSTGVSLIGGFAMSVRNTFAPVFDFERVEKCIRTASMAPNTIPGTMSAAQVHAILSSASVAPSDPFDRIRLGPASAVISSLRALSSICDRNPEASFRVLAEHSDTLSLVMKKSLEAMRQPFKKFSDVENYKYQIQMAYEIQVSALTTIATAAAALSSVAGSSSFYRREQARNINSEKNTKLQEFNPFSTFSLVSSSGTIFFGASKMYPVTSEPVAGAAGVLAQLIGTVSEIAAEVTVGAATEPPVGLTSYVEKAGKFIFFQGELGHVKGAVGDDETRLAMIVLFFRALQILSKTTTGQHLLINEKILHLVTRSILEYPLNSIINTHSTPLLEEATKVNALQAMKEGDHKTLFSSVGNTLQAAQHQAEIFGYED